MDKVFQQSGRSGLAIVDRIVPGPPGSNALLWAAGVIRAVGPASEVARQAKPGTPVFQVSGAVLTAGFIDSHTHFAQWAMKRRRVDLSGAVTLAEAVRRVAEGSREESRDCGMPLASRETAGAAVRMPAAHGISSPVHAIGDAAVRRALDLLEPLGRTALPHRIEHFQCVDYDDLDRAARAGIVLSMQPAHLVDIPLADRHWGTRAVAPTPSGR